MYLSRVEIDYENRLALKELNHLGAFHNWVEQSFPEEIKNSERKRKLWRVDRLKNKNYLLIVSEDKPDFERLEKYGVKGTARAKDYDEFLNTFKNNDRMTFRVVLNPNKSISDRSLRRGKVIPLLQEDEQFKYLIDRSEKNGFSLNSKDFYILKSNFETLYKPNGFKLDLIKAEYQGELTITDVEKFKNALTTGIGKKKAYGFGMMTVIPVTKWKNK